MTQNDRSCTFWRATALGFLLLTAAVRVSAQDTTKNPAAVCKNENQHEVAFVKGYTFKTYVADEWACFQMIREGNVNLRRMIDFP